jgi:nickel-type superoxide dismutase maturation protease
MVPILLYDEPLILKSVYPVRVKGDSMAPRLPSGAFVVAHSIDGATPLNVGDVVVARRPDRPELEIIKRIQAIDAGGAIFLAGDNPASSTDSRQFGAVGRQDILARVRWRYWPLPPIRL